MTSEDENQIWEEDGAPLIALIRDSNPNLRPVDTIAPARKLLTRKKPGEPVPLPTAEDFATVPEEADTSRNLSNPFWKYHVLHFGDGLYLTTNPTPKHINCQALPGYYVKHSGNQRNFSLRFEGIESGEEIICVEKHTTKSGVSFRFSLHPRRKLVHGKFVEDETATDMHGEVTACSFPKELPAIPEIRNINFAWLADGSGKWNIGSVPMSTHSKISSKSPKYFGKHNIYFHDLFTKPNSWHVGETPEVVAMFRRCESSHRKRLIQSVHRLLAKDSKVYGSDAPLDLFAEVKTYALAGDGLHWDPYPKDDEPDHRYKLGWLSIYDDETLLANSGMFDIVVALTVAIAFDQNHSH